LSDWLHNLDWVLPLRTPLLTQFAFGLSWLGYSKFIMLGYWAGDKKMFFRLMLLIMFTAVLNAFTKDFFQDPRRPWPSGSTT
jgi:hypothetical protein